MNYLGVTQRTPYGQYKSKHPNALNYIGTHSFPAPSREEAVTLLDEAMVEAFQAYPFLTDWSKYEGFSRSYYTQEGHQQTLMSYFHTTRTLRPTEDPDYQTMISHCQSKFDNFPRVRSLDFLTQLHLVNYEGTSSAGVGLTGKKGDPGNPGKAKGQATATVYSFMKDPQTTIDNTAPDRAFTRTQLTYVAEKLKIRNIFGQAFQYIFIEGCTAQPLVEMLSSQNDFYFCGLDPRLHVPLIIQDMIRSGYNLISLDWSHFDADVEDYEIEDAFALLDSLLIFPNEESRAAYEFSKVFFIHRKIAGPDQSLWFKHAGVPSGSFYTSLIDSIVNWQRINYLFIKLTGTPPAQIKVQGDDSLSAYLSQFHLNPEQFALAVHRLGRKWLLRPEACQFGKGGQDVAFLQRHLFLGNQKRDTLKVERLALYPEYAVATPQISAYRAQALAEDCNYDSQVLNFAANYLLKKYGLPKPEDIPKWTKPYFIRNLIKD